MKKQLTILLMLSLLTDFVVMAQAQKKIWKIEVDTTEISVIEQKTALERALDTMQVSLNLPSFLIASQNKYSVYAVQGAEPSLDQQYEHVTASGDMALNVQFGTLHSIIRHIDEDYVLFVSAIGESDILLGDLRDAINQFYNVVNSTFNRIKHDLHYGTPYTSATKEEIAALETMIIHYPKKKVQELFNADWMVSYPMNLRGEVYEDKYSQCKAVAVSKNGLNIFFYFMMTDETAENFDRYLQNLKKVFWYNA
jgi:hypothetical protein